MPFLRQRLNKFRKNFDDIFQNENKKPGFGNRLPATLSSIQPDYKFIDVAEKSNQPKDWLLHPTGCVFQFDAQKAQKPDFPDSISD